MSGSPTIAEIRMRQEEERRLEDERRRRAEEERRRREEAERRARLALIAHLRGSLDDEVSHLQTELATLRAEVHASGSPFNIHLVEPEIRAAQEAANRPEALAAALGQVRAIAASVSELHAHVAREAAALSSEQEALRLEADAEAQRLVDATTSGEAEHERQVLQVTGELRVRLEGVEADEVTMTWSRAEVEAVRTAMVEIERAQHPESLAAELHRRLDTALEHAQVRQLAEEKRAYILEALQDGLRQQGFQVGDAILVSDDQTGEVAFRAIRADRRWVEVNVPLEGHVFYDVDGMDRITERGADGLVYTSCDETEARLEALHADLANRFGIKTGELFWETKDPNREGRNANSLPSGGPSATRKQG